MFYFLLPLVLFAHSLYGGPAKRTPATFEDPVVILRPVQGPEGVEWKYGRPRKK